MKQGQILNLSVCRKTDSEGDDGKPENVFKNEIYRT